jgi:hypothetical protein
MYLDVEGLTLVIYQPFIIIRLFQDTNLFTSDAQPSVEMGLGAPHLDTFAQKPAKHLSPNQQFKYGFIRTSAIRDCS